MTQQASNNHIVDISSFDHILERFLFSMACGLLFVDSLTGFFVMKVGVDLKISVLYKLLFLFVGLFQLLRRNYSYFLFSVGLMTFAISWSVAQNITGGLHFLVFDFGEALKLVSTFIVFLVFSTFRLISCKNSYPKFIKITLAVLSLNIFASIIGIGSTAYGLFGAKGFFDSGNALSGIIVIICTFMLVDAIKKGTLVFCATSLFYAILAALIGTKSGILSVIIISMLVLLSRFYLTPKILMTLSALLPIVVVASVFVYQLFLESAIFERIVHFYNTGGLTRAILSDRDLFFWDIYPSFIEEGLPRLLFGYGFEELNKFNKPRVEIDPIDIVFIFGLLTFTVFVIFLRLLFKSVELLPNNDDSVMRDLKLSISISTFVLIVISSIAGHVLFNGFVTFLWGVTIAMPFWRRNNIDYCRNILIASVTEDRATLQ
ncbi:O-antigen ligase family protein [Aliagarivorans taiwanensis]|uniref:O-antigen ligase family protein n=1 Tax=Aliagarivorans taiwanensis TaxID=561966 RepID=UPI00041A48AB|nr:O-antigen ligase family protein [Aliagarivorans taiwanensis]